MGVESIKHKDAKRAHIPSQEEAGYEQDNPVVKEKQTSKYPLNPVVHRGQDPELYWKDKYGEDNGQENLEVDIRSLYRYEHISPEVLIQNLYKLKEAKTDPQQLSLNELFGNALEMDELEKVSEYYRHQDGWSNRLIQGDSLLVMNSLLEREGMAGKVQMIFMDPPYGINYSSNWQMKLGDRNVKDTDQNLTGEPEMIKAYRDTWENGIHSYLTYLKDRLLITKNLLSETGSCFVQISDENLHLVRCLMDQVFGSENFFSLITFKKTLPLGSSGLAGITDYIIWYAKDKTNIKYRELFTTKPIGKGTGYTWVEMKDGTRRKMTTVESNDPNMLSNDARIFFTSSLSSSGYTTTCMYDFEFEEKLYKCGSKSWRTNENGMKRLIEEKRIIAPGKLPCFIQYHADFPVQPLHNLWDDTHGATDMKYIVQTSRKVIQRCILMSTDPGDLVLDPTCGSGTTAYIAEQWGRRWITTDTSRIALNIAKTRLMTANYPYYKLYDEQGKDIRQGFIYKKVPHITLKSLANDEPAEEETLFDQPERDNKLLRVSGPFTVETLQNFNPVSPEDLSATDDEQGPGGDAFEKQIFEHLKTAGVKTTKKDERAVFTRIDRLGSGYLHAEGYYETDKGENKAYFHIGPKFGTVSKLARDEAIRECRQKGDADWLIILGFSFESNMENDVVTTKLGNFKVTKVRMNDDLLQEGLKKKPAKSAASFISIGEPDITLHKENGTVIVEIKGMDIYDPIKDRVNPRDLHNIAYWEVDHNYDGSNFIVKQVFFCGGDKKEFAKWKKGLDNMAGRKVRKNMESTLKIEIDEEAFDRLYGYKSHPIKIEKDNQKIAVRVISQFGEECMKVLEVRKSGSGNN